jgi:hypothetical protein
VGDGEGKRLVENLLDSPAGSDILCYV